MTVLICPLSSGKHIAQGHRTCRDKGAAETAMIDWSLMDHEAVPVAEVALPVYDYLQAVTPHK